MKKLLLFLLAMCALHVTWAYDFSAVAPTGQTLYYNIISGTTNVEVTYPGTNDFQPYNGYTEPTGDLEIPSTVTNPNNGNTYSVTSIRDYTFYYLRSLTSITIPNSVTSIGNDAFSGCSSLTSVTIPNSVTSIGVWAFNNCSSLTNVNYTGTIAEWCGISFGDPSANPTFFAHTLSFNGTPMGTTLTIPNSVTSIGNFAFAHCSDLTSVTIPNSVTSIGFFAFVDCSSLTSVTIPNSVTSIGNQAFLGVKNIVYSGSATGLPWGALCVNGYIEGNLIFTNSSKTILAGCARAATSVTIPNSVTSIGNHAFSGCNFLTSVTIPNSVTSIGDYAFYNCSSLTSITIPNSVTSIGNDAFYNCSSLTSVTIGNSVTSIGDYAFYSCSSLTSVTIPNSVTSIGNSAFYGVGTILYCGSATGAPWGAVKAGCFDVDGDFLYSDNTHTVLAGYIGEGGNVTIPNSVTSIGNRAFHNCSSLTSITIPNSVTSIGDWAFYNCRSLTSVNIPNSVTSIGQGAFYNCRSLTSITIPNSVTSIGNDAFSGCSSLTSITIPNSVTSIGNDAFSGCSSLTSITIPNSVTSIGNYAFSGCTNLKTIYNLSELNIETNSYGFSVNRVVIPAQYGTGDNAIYKIPTTYSFVDEEDNVETNIPRSTIPATNFIYNDNGWKAKEIILTDGQDKFLAPETFTAASASYTRDFTNTNRSTLYLPFSASVPEDLEVYDFSSFANNTLSFTEHSGNLAAYTPYLVGYDISAKDGNTTTCTISATNVTFPKSEATNYNPVTSNGMTFQGVIERTTMSSNNYGYSNGFFVQSGGSAHVNPFRCYFTYSGDTPSQMPPHTLSVAFGDGPLAIDAVETPTQNNGSIRYSNDVYDLMGRLVRKDAATLDGLPTGIYIWKGRKVLAR